MTSIKTAGQLYADAFLAARTRTANENYFVSEDGFTALENGSGFCNFTSGYETFREIFLSRYQTHDGEIRVDQMNEEFIFCHYALRFIIKDRLKIDPILTIGYITYMGQELCKFESPLKITPAGKIKNTPQLYTWLTLPSFEIVDFVFLSVFLKNLLNDDKRFLHSSDFHYLYGSADYLVEEEQIIYHPVYIGADFLIKNNIALIQPIPLKINRDSQSHNGIRKNLRPARRKTYV